jgi:hypothetical protein
MKESSESDQPRLSHVWHSYDCGFNSALSDRSVGSRILENSVVVFTAGWICQVLGHIIEGKLPEFLKDWRFLLVGLRWWLQGATRLVTNSSLSGNH